MAIPRDPPDRPRTVVLTGATRGLGRAMSQEFIARGHRLGGCGRSVPLVERLAKELSGEHVLQSLDVVDSSAVRDWADEVVARLGPPDLLINNAALINGLAPLWEVPEKEFAQIIDVNIKGVVNVLCAFLPAMLGRGQGVVVNISSGAGQSAEPELAPYCATKFAIEGLTQALAQELPEGLAAVPWSPGVIHTDMLDKIYGDKAMSYPTPEQWAREAVPALLNLGPSDNGRSARLAGW